MNNIYSEKVILPCADPIITSYPHHACYMSILGNEEKYACAILDAYIPLAYNATYKRLDFSIGVDIVEFMENLPFLEAEYITRKEFHDSRVSYVSHIKGAIANGFYVYLLIDWDEDSKDRRALLNVSDKSGAGRIRAYQEHEKEFWINLIIPGSQKRNISLYFVDYERRDTDLRIKAFSKYDYTVYWNQELKHIDEGVYVSLLLVGDVIISVKKEKGRLAVISGIFFQD